MGRGSNPEAHAAHEQMAWADPNERSLEKAGLEVKSASPVPSKCRLFGSAPSLAGSLAHQSRMIGGLSGRHTQKGDGCATDQHSGREPHTKPKGIVPHRFAPFSLHHLAASDSY